MRVSLLKALIISGCSALLPNYLLMNTKKTNTVSSCQFEKSKRQGVFQKYFAMTKKELVKLLIKEEDAKNRAYQILDEECLIHKL